MKRDALKYLASWLQEKPRKPLVLRGARQVGKTWLVRRLAESYEQQLIEINFESQPQAKSLFENSDPLQIILNLEAHYGVSINPSNSLLFLDEIQDAPELLAKLRWFKEQLPELAIIAAGSLLEFLLSKHEFSMPVGRITYMHLEPLSFEEFLDAIDEQPLRKYLESFSWQALPAAIHTKLQERYREYSIVGGMPEAVANWKEKHSLDNLARIHHDLLATYRDDFAKYRGQLDIARLDEVFAAIPKMLGEKFVYSKVNREVQAPPVKSALNLLCQAKICHKVLASSASGLPLAATSNEKTFKALFLDVGLVNTCLGLKLDTINSLEKLTLINNGGLAEQMIGQGLRGIEPFFIEPKLFYWVREQKTSNAEVDYILQYNDWIIPIEVKAGSTGSLKSLHQIMADKKLNLAIRFNADLPSITNVETKLANKNSVTYRLLSLPLYMVGQTNRLLDLSFQEELTS